MFFSEAIFYSLNYKYQKSNVYNQSLKFWCHESQTAGRGALTFWIEHYGQRAAGLGALPRQGCPVGPPGVALCPTRRCRVIPEEQLGGDHIGQKTRSLSNLRLCWWNREKSAWLSHGPSFAGFLLRLKTAEQGCVSRSHSATPFSREVSDNSITN